MKFCEDCKHFRIEKKYVGGGLNEFPKLQTDEICGRSEANWVFRGVRSSCYDERNDLRNRAFDCCGSEAKHFEPKIIPGADLRKTFGLEP